MLQQLSSKPLPVGMHMIPATQREFYWTGKIAIGIRHQASQQQPSHSMALIQNLLLQDTK